MKETPILMSTGMETIYIKMSDIELQRLIVTCELLGIPHSLTRGRGDKLALREIKTCLDSIGN